jgi:hypothetical protein
MVVVAKAPPDEIAGSRGSADTRGAVDTTV